ncbi:dTDP-glucose 4,6-dehydratase [Camelliibacillus cellulosilyticus]|uniref:dTDP-glucose 4,6-dehydratase n=1 Tax=Camelliibacillus cellulosilyticus TaxID=2174486 RepID=A0ABV9GLJ3_9BACL
MPNNRTILVTGGAGFIGSNFVPYYLDHHPDDRIINLDKLTYAGRLEHLNEVKRHPRHIFVHGDIGDEALLNHLFKTYTITDVIHFAAESHVDNAIRDPAIFLKTNVQGTFALLNACLRHWSPAELDRHRFHHISTDEVFGALEDNDEPFTEHDAYAPNNPYSASKAAAAMLVRSFHQTYGLNTVVTNCSNNYGPKQHEEKFIPTIIRRALALKEIPVYGDGRQIRDWLYVKDHCRAVDVVFQKGSTGHVYNIGGRNERVNLEIAEMICDLLDVFCPSAIRSGRIQSYRDLITHVKDRPGHDRRYAINPVKVETDLGWRPQTRLKDGLRETVEWYAYRSAGHTAEQGE